MMSAIFLDIWTPLPPCLHLVLIEFTHPLLVCTSSFWIPLPVRTSNVDGLLWCFLRWFWPMMACDNNEKIYKISSRQQPCSWLKERICSLFRAKFSGWLKTTLEQLPPSHSRYTVVVGGGGSCCCYVLFWFSASLHVSTEMRFNLCMWLGEVSSCSCLTVLPGPAWILLN